MKTDKWQCSCGAQHDMVSSVTQNKITPSPGDLTLCFLCGKVYQFGPELERLEVDVCSLPHGVQAQIAFVQEKIAELHQDRRCSLCGFPLRSYEHKKRACKL
jgi:hypothetical protein